MSYEIKQMLVLFLFFGLPGIVAAWIASTKGRSMVGWFLLGCFFPPTIMVIIYQGPLREVKGHYRKCPACNEYQAWKHSACKYCGATMSERSE